MKTSHLELSASKSLALDSAHGAIVDLCVKCHLPKQEESSLEITFNMNSKPWELQSPNILLSDFKTNGKPIATRLRLYSILYTLRLRLGVLVNILHKGPAGRYFLSMSS